MVRFGYGLEDMLQHAEDRARRMPEKGGSSTPERAG
jgi:hypothetical protein